MEKYEILNTRKTLKETPVKSPRFSPRRGGGPDFSHAFPSRFYKTAINYFLSVNYETPPKPQNLVQYKKPHLQLRKRGFYHETCTCSVQ